MLTDIFDTTLIGGLAADAADQSPHKERGGPAQPLLIVNQLTKHFPIRNSVVDKLFGRKAKAVHAVDGVNFPLARARHWASSVNPVAANQPRRG